MWNTYCENIISHRLLCVPNRRRVCDCSLLRVSNLWFGGGGEQMLALLFYNNSSNYRASTRWNCIQKILHLDKPRWFTLCLIVWKWSASAIHWCFYLPRSNLCIARIVTGLSGRGGRQRTYVRLFVKNNKNSQELEEVIDHWFIRVLLWVEKEQGNVQLLLGNAQIMKY